MTTTLNFGIVAGLTAAEQQQLSDLAEAYTYHQSRNATKDKYYEGHVTLRDVNLGIALPTGLRGLEVGCFHSSITFSSERGLKQAINRKINRDLESGKTNDSTHRFIPPDIYFSRLLYFPSYAKRLRVIARVVIDFTPYIPFRRSH